MKQVERITVGELIRQLQTYDKDLLVDFQQLQFYRLKQRSPILVQAEFREVISYDEATRSWEVYDPQ